MEVLLAEEELQAGGGGSPTPPLGAQSSWLCRKHGGTGTQGRWFPCVLYRACWGEGCCRSQTLNGEKSSVPSSCSLGFLGPILQVKPTAQRTILALGPTATNKREGIT